MFAEPVAEILKTHARRLDLDGFYGPQTGEALPPKLRWRRDAGSLVRGGRIGRCSAKQAALRRLHPEIRERQEVRVETRAKNGRALNQANKPSSISSRMATTVSRTNPPSGPSASQYWIPSEPDSNDRVKR